MRIYVGGLPFQTDDAQLNQIFSAYGEVSEAKVIADRDSGRSKGFGFVEMPDAEAAKKAIEELNQADLGGRTITVNEARPMEQRDRGGRGGGGGGYRGGGRGGDRGGDRGRDRDRDGDRGGRRW